MPVAGPSLSAALTARLNYLTDRQAVIAGNIANADTPNYLPRELSFKPYVEAARAGMTMRTTHGRHVAAGQGGGAASKTFTSAQYIEHNGNAVRLDEQLVKMNQTQLDYRLVTQLYSKQAAMQKLAIGRAQ